MNIYREPSIAEMDRILSDKKEDGLRTVSVFVRDGRDLTSEDIAQGYCKLCKAERDNRFEDVTNEVL